MKQLTTHNELGRQLDVFQSKSLNIHNLKEFLGNNARELSFLAFKEPQKWTHFSKAMGSKIVSYSETTTEILKSLGRLSALSHFACSLLPDKGIEFLTNLRIWLYMALLQKNI